MQDPESWLSHNRFSYCMHNPVMYTDPNGEYCLIDDLLAMGLGGVVNVVSNLVSGNIHSFGQGCAYFGIGAVSAEVSLYASPIVGGSLLGGANSALTSYIQTGSVNGQSMAMGVFMGGATSYLGSIVGGKASAWISKWTGKLASPILKSWLPQAFGGSASGFTLSTGMSLLNGESLETALKEGGKGAASGFAIGSLSGIAYGFKNAKSENVSPWTGKVKISVQTNDKISPSTPVGRRGAEMKNRMKGSVNSPTEINGRTYTGHALDRLQGRGIVPSIVEDAINNPTKIYSGNTPNTIIYETLNVKVVVNQNGDVITVIPR